MKLLLYLTVFAGVIGVLSAVSWATAAPCIDPVTGEPCPPAVIVTTACAMLWQGQKIMADWFIIGIAPVIGLIAVRFR